VSAARQSLNKPPDIVRRQIANAAPRAERRTPVRFRAVSKHREAKCFVSGTPVRESEQGHGLYILNRHGFHGDCVKPSDGTRLGLSGRQVSCDCDAMSRILIADDNPD